MACWAMLTPTVLYITLVLPTSKAGQDHSGPRTLAPGCGLGWKASRGTVQRRNTERDIIIFHV